MLAQDTCLAGADLFLELAQGRFLRRLAVVDAALRHLPAFDGLVDALADEDEALAVDQHHADAWRDRADRRACNRTLLAGHENDAVISAAPTMAEAGTRTKPRPVNPCAQAPIALDRDGIEEPAPAAAPRARAVLELGKLAGRSPSRSGWYR